MHVDYVVIDGESVPAKFNPKAISLWEKSTGIKWSEISGVVDSKGNYIKEPVSLSVEDSMILCLEVLREGHRREKKKFKITLDQVYDWASDHELEEQVVKLVFGKEEKEKK
jgi:hypothetical protein